ncbi:MAG: hypothetical protein EOM20_19275, partial [Spartobacteria bacterium]|nr:hypothetical protein [Spartobacteria bacterium]
MKKRPRIMKQISILMLIIAFVTGAARAETVFPGEDWEDQPDPLASPEAVPGGAIRLFAGQFPQSLNYYLDNNVLTADIFGSLYESLLTTDPLTADYQPGLAKRWTISDDKKTFTFELDERAVWSDGTPITAHDVAWTFEAIMNPTNITGVHKVSLQTFEPPVVLDDRVIQFTAKEVHWRNLGAAGGFAIMPKHIFADQDFNKINFEFPVMSGPYRIQEIKEGVYIKLGRRDDWWARTQKRFQQVA